MMRFLRSQSQTVLIIVLGVIGLGFLFYGSAGNLLTSSSGHVTNDYGRIDGEDLSVADVYDSVRTTRDWLTLTGQIKRVSVAGVAEQAWQRLLLLREADRLHINIGNQEVVDQIKSQPFFQKDGVYNRDAYDKTMSELQVALKIPLDGGSDPLASTKAVFENLIRDNLRIKAVSATLFSTVMTPAGEVSDEYEKFEAPTTVSVVTIDPKLILDTVKVTPEQIADEYKAHPENPDYRSKEKRKVDYVLFQLTPDQAKLPPQQKTTALEALGQKALDFALAFQPDPTATPGSTPTTPPDFKAEAQKRGLTPATTDFFAADTPPANVPPSPGFNNAAFGLSKDNQISKVVEMQNGLAVLHLVEIQPSDLLPLDQVKDGIARNLQQNSAQQTAQFKAQITASILKTATAKGTDFKTAAAGTNLKLETLPAFVPVKIPETDSRMQTIAYVASTLAPGQVSDPVPSQSDNTIVIVHLDSRDKADPAGLADFEKRYRGSVDDRLRGMVSSDWAQWKSKQPGTHRPPNLDLYGNVE